MGEDLGKFRVDFPDIEKGCGEVYGTEIFVLGKKRYFDELESTNKEAN